MADNESDDKELSSYLNGNSELSNRYRASNKQEPPSDLDAAILSSAKEAVNVSNDSKQKTKPGFHKAPWVKPLSIAAIITLSVSLVVTMQQETGQLLINEPEMFDSASIIKESALSETKVSSEGVSVMREIEPGQNKDERVAIPAPAALGAAADTYRTEQKTEVPKARMKEAPAKKMLLKEKPQFEVSEDRSSAEEQAVFSAPNAVEFDEVVELKQDRKLTMQETLLKIKALWENDELIKAKQSYEDFIKDYPEVSSESIKEILGNSIYNGLLED